jgi:hypothetical protein
MIAATATVHVSAVDLELSGSYEPTGDVPYLSGPADDTRSAAQETPEGHAVGLDDDRRVTHIAAIDAKWLLERDGDPVATSHDGRRLQLVSRTWPDSSHDRRANAPSGGHAGIELQRFFVPSGSVHTPSRLSMRDAYQDLGTHGWGTSSRLLALVRENTADYQPLSYGARRDRTADLLLAKRVAWLAEHTALQAKRSTLPDPPYAI